MQKVTHLSGTRPNIVGGLASTTGGGGRGTRSGEGVNTTEDAGALNGLSGLILDGS